MQTCGDIGLLQLITTDLLPLFSTRGALVSFGPEKVERNVVKTIHLQSTPSLSSRVIARQSDEMRNFDEKELPLHHHPYPICGRQVLSSREQQPPDQSPI